VALLHNNRALIFSTEFQILIDPAESQNGLHKKRLHTVRIMLE